MLDPYQWNQTGVARGGHPTLYEAMDALRAKHDDPAVGARKAIAMEVSASTCYYMIDELYFEDKPPEGTDTAITTAYSKLWQKRAWEFNVESYEAFHGMANV